MRRHGAFQAAVIRLERVDDADLKRATWRSLAAFQTLLGSAGTVLERDVFVASRVPSANSSLVNAVAPRGDVAPHLDEIEAFYADIPKWGVWLDPADDPTPVMQRGLVLDSTPVLMAAPIEHVERTEDGRVERVAMELVGRVNDAAYGLPPGTMGGGLSAISASGVYPYGLGDAAVAVIQDVGDDAFVTMVATLPDRRGERLASTVLAHALHEAQRRGRTTTSLQASKLGQSIYARLGFRPLGEIHLYEKRPA
jgi:ribosomal protein S18 acetylase RimI-like enzyme